MTVSWLRLILALIACVASAGTAHAHPARGVVALDDGTVYFADAERSVVWKYTSDGRLVAAAPGVHAHWLTRSPDGDAVYADHLRYETTTQKYRQGMVRLSPGPGADTVEDVIAPGEGTAGLDTGYFLIETEATMVRTSSTTPVRLTRGPIAPRRGAGEQVIAELPDRGDVHGLARSADGTMFVTLGAAVYEIDASGAARPLATAEAIARVGAAANDVREPLYAGALWGLCVADDGSVLVCDPSNRRVLRVTRGGEVSVWRESVKPWAPVGVTTRRGAVLVMEAGFEEPARNLGPRVVERAPGGDERVLAEVPEHEPSRPYR